MPVSLMTMHATSSAMPPMTNRPPFWPFRERGVGYLLDLGAMRLQQSWILPIGRGNSPAMLSLGYTQCHRHSRLVTEVKNRRGVKRQVVKLFQYRV
jgi:hypothetical protein